MSCENCGYGAKTGPCKKHSNAAILTDVEMCSVCLFDTGKKFDEMVEMLAFLDSRGGLGLQIHNAIRELLGMSGNDWFTLRRIKNNAARMPE